MSAGKGVSWCGRTSSGSGEGESSTVRISGLVGHICLVDALASWLGDWQAKFLSCIPHIDLRSSLRDDFYSYLCLSSLHLEPTPSTFLLGNNLCNSLSPPSCFKKPT